MNTLEIETRLANLEKEIAELKLELKKNNEPEIPWWQQIRGTFADDEMYDEAMRLGREYRESLRPKDDDEDEE